jgi:PAS domain S-box-containing protein
MSSDLHNLPPSIQRDVLRLAAIVDSSDDAIVSKDLNGLVTTWNRSAERIFGYTAAEMIGQSIRRIIPDNLQQEEDEVLARIRRGERVDHYETVRRRKDGSLVPISLTVSPIINPDGTVTGASKIARDVSETKRVQEERERLLEVAQEAGRLRDEFLATLSHELRTPLNAIVGYSRMLHARLLEGDRSDRALEAVVRNANALTQIVEDVLDISRIIKGKVRLNVQRVELPDVVTEAVETVRPAADAKGVRIETIVDPRAAPVSGDPDRLHQIMWNLLSNAVKFTGRDGRVQVRVERVRSHIDITVNDTGIGIEREFLPHVFERFRQADGGISRERGGLGLGLAITRHLVELQGGRISVASEGRGMGTTFRVELPIMIVHADELAEPREHPQAARTGPRIEVPDLRGIHVLAVDDDADALMLLNAILESSGATVTTAQSAEEALEAIARLKPNVLLADLGMPRIDGFELISRVRRSEDPDVRDMPAAALTAYARSEDRTRAMRSGYQIHLAKPIEPGELLAAIAAISARTPRSLTGGPAAMKDSRPA